MSNSLYYCLDVEETYSMIPQLVSVKQHLSIESFRQGRSPWNCIFSFVSFYFYIAFENGSGNGGSSVLSHILEIISESGPVRLFCHFFCQTGPDLRKRAVFYRVHFTDKVFQQNRKCCLYQCFVFKKLSNVGKCCSPNLPLVNNNVVLSRTIWQCWMCNKAFMLVEPCLSLSLRHSNMVLDKNIC